LLAFVLRFAGDELVLLAVQVAGRVLGVEEPAVRTGRLLLSVGL
jgi:hypothetical protein